MPPVSRVSPASPLMCVSLEPWAPLCFMVLSCMLRCSTHALDMAISSSTASQRPCPLPLLVVCDSYHQLARWVLLTLGSQPFAASPPVLARPPSGETQVLAAFCRTQPPSGETLFLGSFLPTQPPSGETLLLAAFCRHSHPLVRLRVRLQSLVRQHGPDGGSIARSSNPTSRIQPACLTPSRRCFAAVSAPSASCTTSQAESICECRQARCSYAFKARGGMDRAGFCSASTTSDGGWQSDQIAREMPDMSAAASGRMQQGADSSHSISPSVSPPPARQVIEPADDPRQQQQQQPRPALVPAAQVARPSRRVLYPSPPMRPRAQPLSRRQPLLAARSRSPVARRQRVRRRSPREPARQAPPVPPAVQQQPPAPAAAQRTRARSL